MQFLPGSGHVNTAVWMHYTRKLFLVRWTRHVRHCWRSRDKLISDVLLWTPTYGWAKAGQPARTYTQQLCEDTWCSPEDLPEAMNDREKCERGSGISVLVARHDDDDDDDSYRGWILKTLLSGKILVPTYT